MKINRTQVILLASSVVLFGIAVFHFVKQQQSSPTLTVQAAQSLADAVAAEMEARVGGTAKIVLVQPRDPGLFPGSDTEFPAQLVAAIARRNTIHIEAIEEVLAYGSDLSELPDGAPIPPDAQGVTPALSYETFDRIVQRYPDVDRVVSLIGPPRLTSENTSFWKNARVKLVVVMQRGDPTTAQPGLREGIVELAIVPRNRALATATADSSRIWFDSQYQILTPSTADQLE